jgi:hypothetical protein
MFDFKAAANATESSSNFLPAGIHKCTFQGVAKDLVASQYEVMALNLEIENHGPFTNNFFFPNPETGTQRKPSMYGENPSQEEQFMISIMQILEACDPSIKDKINDGTIKFGTTYDQVVKTVQKLTAPYIGKEMEVKLVPGSGKNANFNQIPGFPAKITRNGMLAIATRFIGAPGTLTLSTAEMKKIEVAKNAKPTNMASQKTGDDLISGISLDLNSDNTVDDLPFD